MIFRVPAAIPERWAACIITKDNMQDMITQDGRIKLTFGQTIDHYIIVLFFLFVPVLTTYNLFKIFITETYDGKRTAGELITTAIPFFILAIVFIVVQRNRLKLREIKINYTESQFQEAVEQTIIELKWEIEINDEKAFRARRPWNWKSSWGEMITIFKEDGRLLINSICDPDGKTSVASWGWNDKNIYVFEKNLRKAADKTE